MIIAASGGITVASERVILIRLQVRGLFNYSWKLRGLFDYIWVILL